MLRRELFVNLWLVLLGIWAIVEFVQFMRKRPLRQRMKTAAVWGVAVTALVAGGQMSQEAYLKSYWATQGTYLLLFATGAVLIYWLRVALAEGWNRTVGKNSPPR